MVAQTFASYCKYNKQSPLAEEHIHGLFCCAIFRCLKVALLCLGADMITSFSIAFVLSTTQDRHLGCQTNSNKIKPMSDITKVTGHHWCPLHVQVTQRQRNPLKKTRKKSLRCQIVKSRANLIVIILWSDCSRYTEDDYTNLQCSRLLN